MVKWGYPEGFSCHNAVGTDFEAEHGKAKVSWPAIRENSPINQIVGGFDHSLQRRINLSRVVK